MELFSDRLSKKNAHIYPSVFGYGTDFPKFCHHGLGRKNNHGKQLNR